MSPATLTAHHVSKSYGGRLILNSVALTIAPGDRIGIVGPNGVGKSTLLRLLAREELPDSGRVTIAPSDATVGHLSQEVERRTGESVRGFLARRTGVAGANASLDVAAQALANGELGSDDRYGAALERYLALGAADFDVRVDQVAAEVGLQEDLLDRPTVSLSGGQAARTALGAVLLARYDVFLLDEPTNDLDFEGIDRLGRFLAELPGGAVIVSHDRAFLERTVTAVVEIDEHHHTAARFDGGWISYLEERAVALRHARDRYEGYRDRRDALRARGQRERQWARRGMTSVRRGMGDEPDKHVRTNRKAQTEQLAGRAKRTDRMLERLEVVDKPWEGWQLRLELAATSRSGQVVAVLDGAVVERGSFRLGPVDLVIGWAERVAIVGANGSGKSTLLGAILGRYDCAAGLRSVGPGVVFGELDQARRRFSADSTVGDGFERATGWSRSETRTLLAKFGIGAEHVDRDADSISPGERTRCALALLMAQGANCLVLDEPTNHLDLSAIEQLEQALDTWEGTLLLVTHDRRLLDSTRITRRIVVEDGSVHEAGS